MNTTVYNVRFFIKTLINICSIIKIIGNRLSILFEVESIYNLL
jgi:hypothetical protein